MELRAANEDDLDFLVRLRNDPVSVRFSNRGSLDRETCRVDYLHNASKGSYIAQVAGEDVGYVILEDLGNGRSELSAVLAPEARGKGLGPDIMTAGARQGLAAGAECVVADVMVDNDPPARSLERAGYRLVHADSVKRTYSFP